ncbi:MAG: hybrid sensor histidine kinase/response regulator [Candidatus Margulisiibacteriota bacterium]
MFSSRGRVGHSSDGPLFGKRVVLLVSNDKSLIGKMDKMVPNMGHELVKLPAGQETIPLLMGHSPNLAIIDVKETTSADELAAKIRSQQKHAKIIVLTEYDPVEEHSRSGVSVSQTVDCYLEKNEAEALLPSMIELLLNQQRIEIERNKAEEIAREQSRLAEIGLVLSGVAHELNNYLTGLYGAIYLIAELVEREGSLPAGFGKIKYYLEGAQNSLEQIKTIVQTTQDLGRGNAGNSVFSVNEAVFGVKSLNASDIRRKGIEFEFIPDPAEPMMVGNKQKLIQIVMNLVKNACQAVGERGKIVVMTKNEPEGVRLAVSDNGPGIAESALPTIFNAFYTTKSEAEGTGLGLYIVKKLIDEMGGEIKVTTKPGTGTTFTIFIPNSRKELS